MGAGVFVGSDGIEEIEELAAVRLEPEGAAVALDADEDGHFHGGTILCLEEWCTGRRVVRPGATSCLTCREHQRWTGARRVAA